jgi:hypothetical protein
MTTGTTDSGNKRTSSPQVMFWVTLVRGLLAITLGVALLIQPHVLAGRWCHEHPLGSNW